VTLPHPRLELFYLASLCPITPVALCAQHALVLNAPTNHGLNHRFFEVLAAGMPQVVLEILALWGISATRPCGSMCSERPPLTS
jgi:hypothetical protein